MKITADFHQTLKGLIHSTMKVYMQAHNSIVVVGIYVEYRLQRVLKHVLKHTRGRFTCERKNTLCQWLTHTHTPIYTVYICWKFVNALWAINKNSWEKRTVYPSEWLLTWSNTTTESSPTYQHNKKPKKLLKHLDFIVRKRI